MNHNTTSALPHRIVNVFLAGVLGAALVGFLVGTRAIPVPAPHLFHPPSSASAVPGQTYLELRTRRHGPNGRVTSNLAYFQKNLPAVTDPVSRSEEQHAAAVSSRAERRAFDGSPPLIPHDIDEQNPAGCLTCHERGARIQNRTAPVVSHPHFAQCTQCHVPTGKRPWAETPPVDNSFRGMESPGSGTRASQGAPPTMPHGEWMREDCHSCHGVAGLPGIRTTHPERVNCRQCHAPDNSPAPWLTVR